MDTLNNTPQETAPVPAAVPAPVASTPEATAVPAAATPAVPATPAVTPAPAVTAAPKPVEIFKGPIPQTQGNVAGGWNRFAGYNPNEAKNKSRDGRGGGSQGRR